MYKLLFTILISTFLSANNPKPYAALGDIIFNNVEKINSLQKLVLYKSYVKDISEYVLEVENTKKKGFLLELNKAKITNKEYLIKLRELSKTNDYFLRSIRSNYKKSMDTDNYALFSEIINCGLIDIKKNKDEIIDYYYKHQEDIDARGVIESLLAEDTKLKALKDAQKKRSKNKKIQEEKEVKRIREIDRKAQEDLEIKLQNELQDKELSH